VKPDRSRNRGSPIHYTIYAGYYPVIVHLEKEIRLGQKKQRPDFYTNYLIRILDGFGDELREGQARNDPARYRSKSLNPFLQRTLRGTPHNDPEAIMNSMGSDRKAVEEYYLSADPVGPTRIRELRSRLAGFVCVSSQYPYPIEAWCTYRLLRNLSQLPADPRWEPFWDGYTDLSRHDITMEEFLKEFPWFDLWGLPGDPSIHHVPAGYWNSFSPPPSCRMLP
jgi:hypothetical protein